MLPKTRLTAASIDAIPNPPSGQLLIWDSQVRGFGLRLGTRSKTFFAEGQVRRRTVRVTIGPYGPLTAEVARKKALKVLGDMSQGVNPNEVKRATYARAMTLEAAFAAFFLARPNLSANTTPNYKRSLDLYLADWRARPIGEITRQMVMNRHRKIGEERGEITANNAMRHFRSVYNFVAAAHGELPPNPVQILSQARAWAVERRRRSIIPIHALPRWYAATCDDTATTRDFLHVALFTGMRRSEMAALRWEHIDLQGNTLRVPHTKNGEPLELPLSWFLVDLFGARRMAEPAAEWVFPGRGRSGHIQEMKSFVARVSAASGVRFTLHDLRRTFVTIAESLDIPAYALKRLLNHRIENDVTGGYIVIDAERLRGPVNRIADRIVELVNDQRGTIRRVA